MSLNFGIYLVEQRIISPEQFCGLVKIQQESGATLASVAIRNNLLTIKQVAEVLDRQEMNPNKSFIDIAIDADYLDAADSQKLLNEQQQTSPTIRKLVQECGLLTERQCSVLFQHYLRIGTRPISHAGHTVHAGSKSIPKPTQQPTTPVTPVTPVETGKHGTKLRAPKFKQRPVIVSQYTSPASSS